MAEKIYLPKSTYFSPAELITYFNNEGWLRNDFGNISSEFTSIKTSIEALRTEMIQRYAIANEFDQLN